MSDNSQDVLYMQRAVDLAAKGLYTTTPNPRVGCVIVSASGQIVGEGFHEKAGAPHAEINALTMAGARAQGATAYVTLEPCNHHGRTGPCTEALISAGLARVVYAMEDPNPLVAGQGLSRLRRAGLVVDGPVLEAAATELNPGYIKRMTSGLPWITCKLAMSLDARTAMANGESQWITGPDARQDVQRLRARSCAIITGVNTIIADDPSLTLRDPVLGDIDRQPLRIIVDSHLRTPPQAAIFKAPGETLVATGAAAPAGHPLAPWVRIFPGNDGQVDLTALLRYLSELGLNEVLVESGSRLAGAFLAAGLIDELVIYLAGTLMGSSARPLFDLPLLHMDDRIPLSIRQIVPVGQDWKIFAYPVYRD